MIKPNKKKTVSKIDTLSILTKWLIGKNVSIEPVLNDSNSNSYKYRLFNYILKHPKLVFYINNYLNGLYTFDKYSLENWLDTFRIIFKRYNINSFNHVYFSKYKPAKRITVKDSFASHIEIHTNSIASNNELNELYRLYDFKIISDDTVSELKNINSGKNTDKNLPLIINPPLEDVKSIVIAPTILKFNTTINNYISHRILCKNCPLFNNQKFPIISNLNDSQNEILDVIIIGEYPTDEDFLSNGKLRYIKVILDKYKLKYLATNLVLCKPTGSEIPNGAKTISNCKGVTEHIYSTFNSKFKILIGTKVKNEFNIKGAISKLNGELVNEFFILADPSKPLFKTGLIKLNEYLEKYVNSKINSVNISRESVNKGKIDFNSELKTHTLFDIKVVNENLLYIFIENETGNKKYITEEISFPVYIKSGTYQQCEYIIENCDLVTYLSNQQRQNLLQMMRKDLNSAILI